ncbi:hypothetical protein [Williamsia sp.]|uniref:hypothetical protein n=1 Tax=Williamsia sp. TaxID=1872085 RepID=UPI002F95878A
MHPIVVEIVDVEDPGVPLRLSPPVEATVGEFPEQLHSRVEVPMQRGPGDTHRIRQISHR